MPLPSQGERDAAGEWGVVIYLAADHRIVVHHDGTAREEKLERRVGGWVTLTEGRVGVVQPEVTALAAPPKQQRWSSARSHAS